MSTAGFKERVKEEAIANAKIYESNFVQYEYLICSKAFEDGYHVIKSDQGNYLHLIGIHTELTADDFFKKCIQGKLEESDFDFVKPNKSEKSVKGSVREKIKVLPLIGELFSQALLAEDNFKKNKVECAFATTNNTCTLGFAVSDRPKSLLKGNKLENGKAKRVDLIFRRPRSNKEKYTELIFGNLNDVVRYKEDIESLISDDFFEHK